MIKKIITIMLALLLSFNIALADVVEPFTEYGQAVMNGEIMHRIPPYTFLNSTFIPFTNKVASIAIVIIMVIMVIDGIIAAKKKSEEKDLTKQKIIFYVCIIAAVAIYIISKFVEWMFSHA